MAAAALSSISRSGRSPGSALASRSSYSIAPSGRRAVADRDDVLEAGALAEVLDERPEHLVRDQDAIARVRRDVGQVVGVQSKIERVRDHPAHRDADVGLEVLVVVPGEGADAIAVLQAELVA